MAHFMDKYHPRKGGLVSNVVETAEYGAASFVYGYTQAKYGKKAYVKGIPVDVLSGVALKVVAFGMDAFGGSMMGRIAPHLNVLGNAGVGAFFHTYGVGKGIASSGVTRMLLPSGTDLKKVQAVAPGSTIMGAIPQAPKGDFLSTAELASMAR